MNSIVKRNREKALKKKIGKDGQEVAANIRAISRGIAAMETSVKTLLNEGVELDEFGEVIMPQIEEFNKFVVGNESTIAKLEKQNMNKFSFEELIEIGDFVDEINEKSAAIQTTFENYTGDL